MAGAMFLVLLEINSAISKNFILLFYFKLTKNFEINFYNAIMLFCLAVYLQIKDNKKLMLNFEKITKQ